MMDNIPESHNWSKCRQVKGVPVSFTAKTLHYFCNTNMCFLLFLFSLIMYQLIKHVENKTKNWTALLLVVLGPQNYSGSPLSWPLPESLLILIPLQFAGLWLPPQDISSPVYLGFLFSYLLFFCQWFSVFFRKTHTVTNTVPSSSKLGSISWVFYPPSHHSVSIPPDGLWHCLNFLIYHSFPQTGFLLALHIVKSTLVKVTIDFHDAKSNRRLCLFILFNLSLAFNTAGCCVFLEAFAFICSVILLHTHAWSPDLCVHSASSSFDISCFL